MTYQWADAAKTVLIADGVSQVPVDPGNRDYLTFLLSGAVPLPPDPPAAVDVTEKIPVGKLVRLLVQKGVISTKDL